MAYNMMEFKSSKHYSELVYNAFVRVLKDNKIYPIFKYRVGTSYQSQENYGFLGLKFIRDLVRKAENIDNCNELSSVCGRRGVIELLLTRYHNIPKDEKKLELLLMEEVNYLVRLGLEGLVKNSAILGEVGSSCFTMVCKSVFGDDWVDDTPNEPPAIDVGKLRGMKFGGNPYGITQESIDDMIEQIRKYLDDNTIRSLFNNYGDTLTIENNYDGTATMQNDHLGF